MAYIVRFLLGAALLAASSEAVAQRVITDTGGWSPAIAPREFPVTWFGLVTKLHLTPLEAPAGGRAYRWVWSERRPVDAGLRGPSGAEIPEEGYIDLVVGPSGTAWIGSSWHPEPVDVTGMLPALIEEELAQSDFATAPYRAAPSCVGCEREMLAAIVDGRYHGVARGTNGFDKQVTDASVRLETTALIVGTRRDGDTSGDVCVINSVGFQSKPAMPPALADCIAPAYPETSRSAGHQGLASVGALIRTDGTVTSPRVISSSGAPELDKSALDAVSNWRFSPALDAKGAPIEVSFRATIEFWKDAVDNIDRKSCGDFVTDARWMADNHPDLTIGHNDFLDIVLAERFALEAMINRSTQGQAQRDGERLRAVLVRMVSACSANPSANFIATLRSAMAGR